MSHMEIKPVQQNKTRFNCVYTTIWMHHMDPNKMH